MISEDIQDIAYSTDKKDTQKIIELVLKKWKSINDIQLNEFTKYFEKEYLMKNNNWMHSSIPKIFLKS